MDYGYVEFFTGATVYVVKLKYKKATEPSYANESIIHQAKDIRDEDSNYHLNHFLMSLKTAKRLMFELIMRNNATDDYWFDNQERLEYISIVDCSNYEPYREYQVVDYREFK